MGSNTSPDHIHADRVWALTSIRSGRSPDFQRITRNSA